MISLSLCMIVKNEEDVIGRCLDSIQGVVDEIIVVDTGSTDNTVEIVKKYTDKLYHFQWIDDFAAARNYSFSKAHKEYIMWLDADDLVDESNKNKLKKLKETLDPSVDVVMMKYDVAFDEHNNPTFSYNRERIFRRSKNFQWQGEVHEVIYPKGNTIYSDISIFHKKIKMNDPKRNLKIFEKMIREGKTLAQKQKFFYARELYFNGLYDEAIQEYTEYLSRGDGWVEDNINACQDLAKCYALKQDESSALANLFKSFTFDNPRAEICCDIGKHFFDKNQYKLAIFWYELALTSNISENSDAYYLPDCYGYIPYIHLCVCYDKLGNPKKAYEYNRKAGEIKPKDKNYLHNVEYFKQFHLGT